jgi:hypothetical protein
MEMARVLVARTTKVGLGIGMQVAAALETQAKNIFGFETDV